MRKKSPEQTRKRIAKMTEQRLSNTSPARTEKRRSNSPRSRPMSEFAVDELPVRPDFSFLTPVEEEPRVRQTDSPMRSRQRRPEPEPGYVPRRFPTSSSDDDYDSPSIFNSSDYRKRLAFTEQNESDDYEYTETWQMDFSTEPPRVVGIKRQRVPRTAPKPTPDRVETSQKEPVSWKFSDIFKSKMIDELEEKYRGKQLAVVKPSYRQTRRHVGTQTDLLAGSEWFEAFKNGNPIDYSELLERNENLKKAKKLVELFINMGFPHPDSVDITAYAMSDKIPLPQYSRDPDYRYSILFTGVYKVYNMKDKPYIMFLDGSKLDLPKPMTGLIARCEQQAPQVWLISIYDDPRVLHLK